MASEARTTFRYFAYGSNMLAARIKARCPSARPLGVAQLPGHELRWHKRSKDGSSKCNVVPATGGQAVFGVLYQIDTNERTLLDRYEGLGRGYREEKVTVILNGQAVDASAYVATNPEQNLRPYAWYKAMVVAGAIEHGLPKPYIASLGTVEALEDPDRQRHEREMRIVSGPTRFDGAPA